MIKICYIIGQLARGGAEKQLYELVKNSDKKQFYPVVISLSQGGFFANEIRELNIKVIEIARKKNREFSRLFKLIKLIREIKPEIVHTFLFSANSYGRIAAILCRVPVIIASERNSSEMGKDKTLFEMFIDKIIALFTDAIICNSHKAADMLVKRYCFNEKKVFTVHNSINGIDFLKGNYSCDRKIAPCVIGTVGRLYPQKNHKLFLDIVKLLSDMPDNDHVDFLIVGNGPLRGELESYSKKLGIRDKVLFTGERTDIPDLLQNMDVFVITSLYEGLSNAIMEAMAAGLPVVATNVGGNSELIIDGETGFLYHPNEPLEFTNKIHDLLNNKNMAKQMGENGKKRIISEFNTEKMIRGIENIYLALLGRRNILEITK